MSTSEIARTQNNIRELGTLSAVFGVLFAVSAQATMNFHPETITCAKAPNSASCVAAEASRSAGVKIFGGMAAGTGIAAAGLAAAMLAERRRLTRPFEPTEPS